MFTRLIKHHTVTPYGTGEAIAAQKKYHVVVDFKNGRWVEIVSVPHHQRTTNAVGHLNTGSFSIAYCGDYTKIAPPPLELMSSIAAKYCQRHKIHHSNIYTHRQAGLFLVAPGNRYSTACAGKITDLIPQIRLAVAKKLGQA